MIRELQGKYGPIYVISSDQVAIPGCYDSERAAKYAFRFPNSALQRLQDKVNDAEPDHEKRVITFEMLQELRRQTKEKSTMLSENIAGVLAHKKLVATYLQTIATELNRRALVHDDSKFLPEELDAFELMTPILKTLTYGTNEYKAALKELGPALQHHYQVNDHHPEHTAGGVNAMNLVQLIEMVCDWMAAVQRMKDGGDIEKSLEINQQRFGMDDQLTGILRNTVDQLYEGKRAPDPNTLYPDVLGGHQS
jgi:hypothetical protein